MINCAENLWCNTHWASTVTNDSFEYSNASRILILQSRKPVQILQAQSALARCCDLLLRRTRLPHIDGDARRATPRQHAHSNNIIQPIVRPVGARFKSPS